jgi:hypothetical protein
MTESYIPEGGTIKAGLLIGSIAAVVTALASLPLHSPHDGLLNTGSVVLATLVVGVIASLTWRYLPQIQPRFWVYIGLMSFVLGKFVGVAYIAEIWIDRMVSFTIPLACIAFAITTVGIPMLAKVDRMVRWRVVIPVVLIALAIGVGLAGQGDQESGRLELPPRSTNIEAIWSL